MPGGRPRIISSPEEMDKRVDDYFVKCEEKEKRPTLTGMILALGITSKQGFYEYQKRSEFSDSVKRARMLIENTYEEMLGSNHAAGPIFALKNMDWSDKQEVKHSGGVSHGVALLPEDADLDEYLKNAKKETT